MPDDVTPKRRRGRPPKSPVQVLQLTPEEQKEQRYTPGLHRDTRNPRGAIRQQQLSGLLKYRDRRQDRI